MVEVITHVVGVVVVRLLFLLGRKDRDVHGYGLQIGKVNCWDLPIGGRGGTDQGT